MGISAYLICRSDGSKGEVKTALTVYFIQLALNFSWSIIFFRFQMMWTGALIIALMIIAVGVMIYLFYRLRKSAGLINLPYILWLCFALYLNVATALINRV
jgi:tryptophan-rich sensory protein